MNYELLLTVYGDILYKYVHRGLAIEPACSKLREFWAVKTRE